MRHRNVYVNSLAKLLELGVLMNTPIKKGGAEKEKRRDSSIPVFVHIGIRGYNISNIRHILSIEKGKQTRVLTFSGDSFDENVPFLEVLEILKKGGE